MKSSSSRRPQSNRSRWWDLRTPSTIQDGESDTPFIGPPYGGLEGRNRRVVAFDDPHQPVEIAPRVHRGGSPVDNFLGPFHEDGSNEGGERLAADGRRALQEFLELGREPHFEAIGLG